MSETLFRINWGDGDDSFVIAPDEATAISRMPDGKDMVNYVVRLDALYRMIYKAGQREVVEWVEKEFGYYTEDGLTRIIIDDDGYFGHQGNIGKWQAYSEGIEKEGTG